MRLLFILVLSGLILSSCSNSSSAFKEFIVGDWQIENPTLQSFIRFNNQGKVTFYFNRFSYEKDSLAEYGKWRLKEIKKGVGIDTFLVELEKKPSNTLFKMLIVNENKLKIIDDLGYTLFTRLEN
ncbi:hypothetical protein N9866_00020 [Flavobacteriaceae bacterium]|jgi:hypothetical protein|nr:hypothetical protein [Flavobacteriaceae bacterium]MBT4313752.1 hypothetical protein [Flavobacteriaceae bacterium]MBT5091778.1 hypothetical protein [Flavobacteriaceae bacterium]MBT5283308.1 hypothetical protein [Flavobacteriaceae bacterium]MBT5446690.1 hypothetical protein [Flavobacteriaceae bacterium]|tara:strand:+ start:7048 stop:7422 length:375 start_codon:yes stop_codon:yes gene_type:complete